MLLLKLTGRLHFTRMPGYYYIRGLQEMEQKIFALVMILNVNQKSVMVVNESPLLKTEKPSFIDNAGLVNNLDSINIKTKFIADIITA